jgi:flagellar hook-associated protein 2
MPTRGQLSLCHTKSVGLQFDPVGGGQFKLLVEKILQAEAQPLRALDARRVQEEQKLKLFNDFKGRFESLLTQLSNVNSVNKLRELKIDLGDGRDLVDITLDKAKAETGQYNMEVDELAGRTSIISNGFKSATDPVLGPGMIVLNLEDGNTVQVFIEEGASSLRGIAARINETTLSPVRANVVQDFSDAKRPWRLLLVGKDDGASQQVDFPDLYFLDGIEDLSIDDSQTAQNGRIKIDGFDLEVQKNFIQDFVPGVNVALKQAAPDRPFTFTITEDFPKIATKIREIIDSLNGVLKFIIDQNAIDDKTDTSTTFAGDTSLQSIEFQIRNLLHQVYLVGENEAEEPIPIRLSDLGVEFDRTGLLTFSDQRFNQVIQKDFRNLAQALSGPKGFTNRLATYMTHISRSSDGMVRSKEKAMKDRIRTIEQQMDDKQRHVERKEQDLVARFARLQGTLGDLQRQQQYMSAALPGSGGGSTVAQLLG